MESYYDKIYTSYALGGSLVPRWTKAPGVQRKCRLEMSSADENCRVFPRVRVLLTAELHVD
ncbi:unnamed protein product [Eruca vesicaria subsp. sativa]|uniref:Uncharacterized protein n=1 Tax=Eruca vesicaria subsp. sativa TaxID=29727 RepID=A0ABC8K0P3_ERUVS|nr:unnamed protein product [Eruca vesicaria subsp. sativa]